jgi:hypothetical protein
VVLRGGAPQGRPPDQADAVSAVSGELLLVAPAHNIRLGVAEKGGVEPVHEDPVEAHAELLGELLLELEGLVDRHLLRPGHRADAGLFGVSDEAEDGVGLALDRPDPRDVAECLRRPQQAETVSRGRGVDDHQVVLSPFLDPAVELGQLPHLADGHELAQARGRGGEVGKDPVLEHHLVEGLDPDLEEQVLLQGPLGIDRERE